MKFNKVDLINFFTYLVEHYSSRDNLSDYERGLLAGYKDALEMLKKN